MSVTPRRTFPPVITASDWGSVFGAAFKTAANRRKRGVAPDGWTMVPRLTNGEVIQVIMGWLAADPSVKAAWPLWYQFAAVAYGWNPTTQRMVTTPKQRDALYPSDLMHELWMSQDALAYDLDKRGITSPRLDLDGSFDDVTMQGAVAAALAEDGGALTWGAPKPTRKATVKPKATAPKADNGLGLALVLGAAWLMFGKQSRRYRRTRG